MTSRVRIDALLRDIAGIGVNLEIQDSAEFPASLDEIATQLNRVRRTIRQRRRPTAEDTGSMAARQPAVRAMREVIPMDYAQRMPSRLDPRFCGMIKQPPMLYCCECGAQVIPDPDCELHGHRFPAETPRQTRLCQCDFPRQGGASDAELDSRCACYAFSLQDMSGINGPLKDIPYRRIAGLPVECMDCLSSDVLITSQRGPMNTLISGNGWIMRPDSIVRN